MTDEPRLRECPFCGAPGKYIDRNDGANVRASCTICGIGTLWFVDRKHARERWNRRPPDPLLQEMAGALEGLTPIASWSLGEIPNGVYPTIVEGKRALADARAVLSKYTLNSQQPKT